MVISIIGSGALGKLYGGLLALSGHEVHFLMRSEYNQIKEQAYFDLNFKQLDKVLRVENPNIYSDATQLPKSDLIIITLKTTDNASLKNLLVSALKKDSTVLVIQNGLGNEEFIQTLCPTQTIISCISSAGATRQEHAKVDVFFLGALKIAPVKKEALNSKYFSNLFTGEIDLKITAYDDYRLMRWQKLIWSVPFCALSIMYDQPCNVIASTKPYVNTAQLIMSELQDVAASIGISISNDYIEKILDMTRGVKDYYPSMYWDYKNEQPIEKEYILENVIKAARANHVSTPCLNLVIRKLDELTQSKPMK